MISADAVGCGRGLTGGERAVAITGGGVIERSVHGTDGIERASADAIDAIEDQ
ncbi:MAG: hypothetical protein R3F65_15105 [bacterium]